jgi:NadR type nicotinamide-nucleotide adenylyltransferase
VDELKKIVVTGAESSGKSTLCKSLAEHFKAPWVPEFARQYLEKKGPQYDFQDFENMLQGHLAAQQQAFADAQELVFLDTDLINYAVWAQFVFGRTSALIEANLAQENTHQYLICYPDLPWQADPLRENKKERLAIFKAHLNLIKKLNRPFYIVKGSGSARLKNALKALATWQVGNGS